MSGLDLFVKEYKDLKSVPAAVLANHATLSHSGYPTAYELVRQGFSIKKIFSPEHGISSQGEDGKEQPSGKDDLTQLPVVSLYGKSLYPGENDLRDVDFVIIDLPNIGCRFYTYWWTMTYMVEVCSAAGKKIVLLDRPNLSKRKNITMEGPMLDETNCSSFLGRWRMPLTYSYSYGQLIRWFIAERNISVALEVIPYEESHNDVFIPPSPSMNEWQTTLIYPGTGLFEGLNINTGRGTAFPFRVIGAPWINSIQLHDDFSKQQFPGVKAFPYSYRPEWSRYQGEICHGLYFYVDNHLIFKPCQAGLWLMNYLSVAYPNDLMQATYPTIANPSGENHLDLLLGIKSAYVQMCSGSTISNTQLNQWLNVSAWTDQVDSFLARN